jgi:predicted N-acetyltransferase YhbS
MSVDIGTLTAQDHTLRSAQAAQREPEPMIDYLAYHPLAVPTVAAWLFKAWGHRTPNNSLEATIERIAARAQIDAIPFGLVAIEDGVPVGTASVVAFDDPGDIPGPWLSSVYVIAKYRGRGLAKVLAQRAEVEAARLGASKLVLTAAVPQLYSQLGYLPAGGWKHGEPIMEKLLPARA